MKIGMKVTSKLLLFLLIVPSYSLNAQKINVSVIEKTLSSLTVTEKLALIVGAREVVSAEVESPVAHSANLSTWAYTNAIEKKNIPRLTLATANGGLASANHPDLKTTAFPMPAVLAASWNKELVREVGSAIAKEAAYAGVDVLLAPSANVTRNPLEGRNTEYFSEDPNLVAQLASAMVKGMQAQGVQCCLKYWYIDNQEANRTNVNVLLDGRTLREFYLRTFEKVVRECQPWGILAAYPKVNGTYQTEDSEMLQNVLRGQWKYEGVVLSDFYAGRDAVKQLTSGTDVLLPGSKAQYDALLEAVQSGKISKEQLDNVVRRLLKAMMKTPAYLKHKKQAPDMKAHADLARKVAGESIVLLKNMDECLPLKDERVKRIAFYGVASYHFVQGDGSVNATEYTSPALALAKAGYVLESTLSTAYMNYFKTLFPPEKKEEPKTVPTAKSPTAKSPASRPAASKPKTPQLSPAERLEQELSKIAAYPFKSLPKELAFSKTAIQQHVKGSQVAVITIGRMTPAGCDRTLANSYQLSELEVKMIRDVSSAYHAWGKKVIVILNVDGVVDVNSWVEYPDAILWCGPAGQGAPAALADIIKGKMSPSGKLSCLWPKSYQQLPSAAHFPENYQGKAVVPSLENNSPSEGMSFADETVFAEKMQIGYRYFDEHQEQVMYPFGHGLSYTTFSYDKMFVELQGENVYVRVRVTNTGKVAGKESLQLYVSPQRRSNHIEKPLKTLIDFTKTSVLDPGESQEVFFVFPLSELSVYDEGNRQWILEKGNYTVKVGASANNILTQYPLQIVEGQTYPLEWK